jgi:hypothetical protein
MIVDVNVGIESFPECACGATGFGPSRAGAHAVHEIHRCERFTPRDSLSSPGVREIRWFLHLRFARDVPGKAPSSRVRQTDARSQQTHPMSVESFPLATASARLITKRKRAAFHRKGNGLEYATLCDINL